MTNKRASSAGRAKRDGNPPKDRRKPGEPDYRMLVEAMSEGAATLSGTGAVLYSNRRFAEMIRRPTRKLVGIEVQSLLEGTERDRFGILLSAAQKELARGEFNLRSTDGDVVPVNLSLTSLRGFDGHALELRTEMDHPPLPAAAQRPGSAGRRDGTGQRMSPPLRRLRCNP